MEQFLSFRKQNCNERRKVKLKKKRKTTIEVAFKSFFCEKERNAWEKSRVLVFFTVKNHKMFPQIGLWESAFSLNNEGKRWWKDIESSNFTKRASVSLKVPWIIYYNFFFISLRIWIFFSSLLFLLFFFWIVNNFLLEWNY